MEMSLSEGSLKYNWVFNFPSGPQNVRMDKNICNFQAPQVEIHAVPSVVTQ